MVSHLPDRLAIMHDWLDKPGGAERVLQAMIECFPSADIYALVDMLAEQDRGVVLGKRVTTSFLQKLPGARRHFRTYLPLMPIAVEQFDLSRYDVVISSSWAVAKGVITSAEQLHIAYVHTPMRYVWDQQHEYLSLGRVDRGVRGALVRLLTHWLRLWDSRTANGVDVWLCNSANVARRIRKIYGRSAQVLHPPVPVDGFPFSAEKQDFYLTCSRLVQYKRMDLIVEAFKSRPGRHLIVVGDGPELGRLRKLAGSAANITFMGRQPDDRLREMMRDARAFVFAANEDFGIVPLEAQACGTPVIAYGRGGALETIRGLDAAEPTGCFFFEQTPDAIARAVDAFEGMPVPIGAEACRANARRFSAERFAAQLQAIVAENWTRFQTDGVTPKEGRSTAAKVAA
jgi:glycosyltransferase involved in cell wall biosynthesis